MEFEEISRCILEGDTEKALGVTKRALAAGIPAKEILDKGLVVGLAEVGEMYASGQYFLPELLIAGEAAKYTLESLKKDLRDSKVPPFGKFIMGTVQGDVHDIGKNIVIMMLEGNGWEVTDLGVDVAPQQFCEEVNKGSFDIVGLSALLTSTMVNQVETIKALRSAGLRDKVKIMIGGAPVTQAFADEIGADAYAVNVVEAVKKAATLVGRNSKR